MEDKERTLEFDTTVFFSRPKIIGAGAVLDGLAAVSLIRAKVPVVVLDTKPPLLSFSGDPLVATGFIRAGGRERFFQLISSQV